VAFESTVNLALCKTQCLFTMLLWCISGPNQQEVNEY